MVREPGARCESCCFCVLVESWGGSCLSWCSLKGCAGMSVGAGVFREQVCRLWCCVRPVKHPAGPQGLAAGEQARVAGPVASCQRLRLATRGTVQSCGHGCLYPLLLPAFCPGRGTASIRPCTSSELEARRRSRFAFRAIWDVPLE